MVSKWTADLLVVVLVVKLRQIMKLVRNRGGDAWVCDQGRDRSRDRSLSNVDG
jgi:hypothetical protein